MLNGRFVDLTLTYDERMSGVSFEDTRVLERDGWNARTLHIYGHAGTHMDAPRHFGVSNRSIDQYGPADFIGKAHILRLNVTGDSRLISVPDLQPVADRLQPGDSLVIQTGWSSFVFDDRYRDGLPRISDIVAEYLVDRKIKMLGVETPSVADVNNLDELAQIHRILLDGNVIIIEGLTNLNQIKNDTFTLLAFPLKIKDGDGAPARVIAFED